MLSSITERAGHPIYVGAMVTIKLSFFIFISLITPKSFKVRKGNSGSVNSLSTSHAFSVFFLMITNLS